MADYKILIKDFIRALQKLDADDVPDEQIVKYVRRNSSRLIDEKDLDEVLITNLKKVKNYIPKFVTIKIDLEPNVYEAILKQIKGFDWTVEKFVNHALIGYMLRREILNE